MEQSVIEGGRPLRLLLVDSNTAYRDLLARRLEAAGVAVVGTGEDVAPAVRLVAALQPDLVIAEHALPSGSAARLAGALREAQAAVPVLVQVAWTSPAADAALAGAGVAGTIAKDAPFGTLLAAIERAAAADATVAPTPAPPSAHDLPVEAEQASLRATLAVIGATFVGGGLLVFGPQAWEVLTTNGARSLLVAAALVALVSVALGVPLVAQRQAHRRAAAERDELRAQHERLRTFVASAAHDLKTPATVVAGFSGLLDERWDDLDDETRVRMVQGIVRSGGRLSGLLDDLMTTALAGSGELRLVTERVDVADVVRRAVEQSLAATTQVQTVGLDDVEVLADARALQRVLANLFDNAVKYGRPPLVVAGTLLGGRFRLQVIDHGDGVAPEFVPRLFDRLAQDRDSDVAGDGVGLGLHVVRSFATEMGADLRYSSAGPGATFEIDLPVPDATGRAWSGQSRDGDRGAGRAPGSGTGATSTPAGPARPDARATTPEEAR